MNKSAKVVDKKEVFNEILKVEKGTVKIDGKSGEESITRLRVKRPDAVAVFIYNGETEKVVLVKQFRFAIHDKVNEPIYELMAGKIDGEDSPEETAVREAEEECGYKLNPDKLKKIAEFFASPGYTSEKFYLYYAEVTNADKITEGGGLEDEHEYIEVVEMGKDEFTFLLKNGGIQDAKTLVGGLYVVNKEWM